MHSFIDVKNKLVEDGIASSEQFENVDENGFVVHLDDEYTIRVYPDEVNLDRVADKKWKNRSTHTHQDMWDGNVYEATYEIVKEYAEDYKTIFKDRTIGGIVWFVIILVVFCVIEWLIGK